MDGLPFKGDTIRRVLLSRLEPQIENPEDRKDFHHPDLLGWLRQERRRLVVSALTLLRAYFVAGCPSVAPGKASFEAWSKIVPNAIAWAGGANPLLAVPGVDADEEKDALRGLFAVWPKGKPYTAKELVDISETMIPEDSTERVARAAFKSALRDFFDGTKATAVSVSGLLGRSKGRIIEGKKLIKAYDSHAHTNHWYVG